jgi:hypothetical protein
MVLLPLDCVCFALTGLSRCFGNAFGSVNSASCSACPPGFFCSAGTCLDRCNTRMRTFEMTASIAMRCPKMEVVLLSCLSLHNHSILGKGIVCDYVEGKGRMSISAGAVEPVVCPSRFYCPAVDGTLDALPRLCPVGAYCNQTGLAVARLCPAGYASSFFSSAFALHFQPLCIVSYCPLIVCMSFPSCPIALLCRWHHCYCVGAILQFVLSYCGHECARHVRARVCLPHGGSQCQVRVLVEFAVFIVFASFTS